MDEGSDIQDYLVRLSLCRFDEPSLTSVRPQYEKTHQRTVPFVYIKGKLIGGEYRRLVVNGLGY